MAPQTLPLSHLRIESQEAELRDKKEEIYVKRVYPTRFHFVSWVEILGGSCDSHSHLPTEKINSSDTDSTASLIACRNCFLAGVFLDVCQTTALEGPSFWTLVYSKLCSKMYTKKEL